MLNVGNLESDIAAAFQSGMDGASKSEVAQSLTQAIVDYSANASVLAVPGPILVPSVPPIPSTMTAAKLTVQTHQTGFATLLNGVNAQFSGEDATLATLASAIQLYVGSSFTAFAANPPGHSALGVTVMAAPPVLLPVGAAGLAGESLESCAKLMANIIHTAYLSSVFTGVGTGADGGIGPVAGPLM